MVKHGGGEKSAMQSSVRTEARECSHCMLPSSGAGEVSVCLLIRCSPLRFDLKADFKYAGFFFVVFPHLFSVMPTDFSSKEKIEIK